ncbi:MAG: U32 family peptidase [Planctomycetes bacterium]|nr:U32 family peptidase [Planctomycetota bacterium]
MSEQTPTNLHDRLPTRRVRPEPVPAPVNPEAVTRNPLARSGPELLAPAGCLESFFAAMSSGADAVYLGLKKFSARDNAINFSLEELDAAVGHAHSIGRKVYVAINTVVQDTEWPELVENLAACEELGVDAVILQDMGVYRAIRERFPRLKWHASTQMLIHNAEGARWAERNGFERVILARELTLAEIESIRKSVNIQLEAFVHGSLCYSYSGLCLFSSQEYSRSGNRGKCTYICRDTFKTADGEGKPFSMRDLFAPAEVPALAQAGVASLKIEGRRKAPLYVAAVTDLYRQVLDGKQVDVQAAAEQLKTIYSRETTTLFLHSSHGNVKAAADPAESEPQGLPLGKVSRVFGDRVHFTALADFERHDGLMARPAQRGTGDQPGVKFGADRINLGGKRVFTVKAGEEVSVAAPPEVREGDELRLISSNALKRRYPTGVPRKLPRSRLPVRLDVALKVDAGAGILDELGMPGRVEIIGRVFSLELRREYPCKLLFADSQPLNEDKLREFFERLGSTRFELKSFSAVIPAGVFIPAAEVNEARRKYFEDLEEALVALRRKAVGDAVAALASEPKRPEHQQVPPTRFTAMVDRAEYLAALPLEHLDEVILDIGDCTREALEAAWEAQGTRLRVAVPLILRAWTKPAVQARLEMLFALGARRFLVGNLGGFEMVARVAGIDRRQRVDTAALFRRPRSIATRDCQAVFEPKTPDFQRAGVDVACDWPCYAMSRETIRAWLEQGVSRVTLSIEDGEANLRRLLAEFAAVSEVVLYQDTPLFTAESCVHANMLGHCPGKAKCDFKQMDLTAPDGHTYLALDKHCQTIVLNQQAFSWAQRRAALEDAGAHRFRLDFIHRPYSAEQIRAVCEHVMNGQQVAGTHEGNWSRGLQ